MSGQTPGPEFRPINPVTTVLVHLRLIAAVTAAMTLFLAVLILIKFKPVYVTESAIEVELIYPRILHWDQEKQFSSHTQYTDYMNTQVNHIVSIDNLRLALEKMPLPNANLEFNEDDRVTTFLLRQMVRVDVVRNTHLITVAMESTEPRDLDVIVNAIVDAYMARSHASEVSENDSRVNYLRDELEKKRRLLDEQYAQMAEFTKELVTFNFLESANPYDETLRSLRGQINDARVELAQAENNLDAIVFTMERGKELGLEPHVQEFVYRDLNTVDMKNLTFSVQEELNRQSTFLKPTHPSSKRLKEFANTAKTSLDTALGDSRKLASDILYGKMEIDFQNAIAQAQAQVDAKRDLTEELQGWFREEKRRLIETTPDFLKAAQIKAEAARLEDRITQMESRIEELVIESYQGGRTRVQSRATPPLFPLKDRRKPLLVLAAIMSLVLALVLAFAIDFLDPRLTDPRYLGRIVGARPTGILPHREEPADFGQLLHLLPQTYHADLFRRIMPRIFSPDGGGPRPGIYTVVSTDYGCGASSFALNTARHLQLTGVRGALFDFNTHAPALPRRIEGWDLAEAAAPLPEPLARRFPLALRSDGAAFAFHYFQTLPEKEVFANEARLKDLLEHLKPEKGPLIVDSPPLLKHFEAELLCRHSDVVVLVVSGVRNTAGEIKRAMALLEDLGVKHCAVIANDLPILPGGYFHRAMAAFEGNPQRYPLLHDLREAVWKAFFLDKTRLRNLGRKRA